MSTTQKAATKMVQKSQAARSGPGNKNVQSNANRQAPKGGLPGGVTGPLRGPDKGEG